LGTTANKQTALDLINAISLLIQLEIAGVNVSSSYKDSDAAAPPGKSIDSRWEELANSVSGHIHEHILSLYDLHYIYAIARVGRDEWVEQMIESIQVYAKTAKPCIQKAWTEVTLPAAQGMVAYARGEWATTTALLQLVLPRLHEVGGSDAQRDLFEQIYLDCLIRTEENEQARQLLEKRAAVRDKVPSIQRELARISQQ
jgi:hypothetical protein